MFRYVEVQNGDQIIHCPFCNADTVIRCGDKEPLVTAGCDHLDNNCLEPDRDRFYVWFRDKKDLTVKLTVKADSFIEAILYARWYLGSKEVTVLQYESCYDGQCTIIVSLPDDDLSLSALEHWAQDERCSTGDLISYSIV